MFSSGPKSHDPESESDDPKNPKISWIPPQLKAANRQPEPLRSGWGRSAGCAVVALGITVDSTCQVQAIAPKPGVRDGPKSMAVHCLLNLCWSDLSVGLGQSTAASLFRF